MKNDSLLPFMLGMAASGLERNKNVNRDEKGKSYTYNEAIKKRKNAKANKIAKKSRKKNRRK
jgi:hypothetical protein